MDVGNKRKLNSDDKARADEGPARQHRKVEQEHGTKSLEGVQGTGVGVVGPYNCNPEFLAALIYAKAEQLRVPDNKVFIAERTDLVVDVFKGLIKHNFLSVPVLQKTKHKWYGFLDLADIVQYVVQIFGEEKLSGTDDFWLLVEREELFQKTTVNDIMRYPLSKRNPFHPVKAGYSLLYAIEALAKEKNLHRVPVVDEDRQLMNLITQSQVVRFLLHNLPLLGDKRLKPVAEMFGVIHQVYTVNMKEKAIVAFNQMVEKEVSAVAVVNDEGKIKGTLSMRDLKAMSTDARFFWRLYQPIETYLPKVRKETPKGLRPRRVQTCKIDHTLEHVIKELAEHNIHRVFIVDDARRPIGVIALKDVLLEILTP